MPQMRRDLEVWFWLVLSSMRVYNTPPWLAQAEGKQKLGFAKLSPKPPTLCSTPPQGTVPAARCRVWSHYVRICVCRVRQVRKAADRA